MTEVKKYIANDGTEFDNKDDCEDYENELENTPLMWDNCCRPVAERMRVCEVIGKDLHDDRFYQEHKIVADMIENQIEAEKKPKRRIDTMTEEELAKTIEAVNIDTGCCKGCVLGDLGERCLDGYADCGQAIAHYLLSPAEEEKK